MNATLAAEFAKATPSRSRLRAFAITAALLALAAVAVAAPWLTSFGTQRLLVEVLTIFTITLTWNLLAGYGGLVAVGHNMFVGVGAYALFATSNVLQLNPWLALPMAAVFGALLALVSAWPLFRLSGAYFAVATWVIAEMLRIAATNTPWLGASGGLPLAQIRDFDRFTRNAGTYWAALAVGAGALWIARLVLRGRLGLALMSVRDSELAAAASGVDVKRAKLALWLIAGALTGLAGGVAYMNTLQVTPDASFGQNWTAIAIFATVLGGIGTLEGPFLGTLLYFVLRELFSGYGTWYFIGLGALAMVTMVVAPGGAWSLIDRRGRFDPLALRRRMER